MTIVGQNSIFLFTVVGAVTEEVWLNEGGEFIGKVTSRRKRSGLKMYGLDKVMQAILEYNITEIGPLLPKEVIDLYKVDAVVVNKQWIDE